MSEIKVNTINPFNASEVTVNSPVTVRGTIDTERMVIQNFNLNSETDYRVAASKFYVDNQFAIRGIGATGISGLSALQAGLSAEAQAIRAESDSKYMFTSRGNIHSSGGITFSAGPYRFGSNGSLFALDTLNSRVGLGLTNAQTLFHIAGGNLAFSNLATNPTVYSFITNDSSNNLLLNAYNRITLQSGGAEMATFHNTGPGDSRIKRGNFSLDGLGRYISTSYNGTDNQYRGYLGWNWLQFGNNGPNYIVAGNTNVNGSFNFVVNNTEALTGTPSSFSHNGITAMTIYSTGRVGINTNIGPTVSVDYPLVVGVTGYKDAISVSNYTNNFEMVRIGNATTSGIRGGAVAMWVADGAGNALGSAQVNIRATGNSWIGQGVSGEGGLGIGTPTPYDKVHICLPESATIISSGYSQLHVANTNTNTPNNFARIAFSDSNSSGNQTALIGARIQNHTSKHGELFFATRGTPWGGVLENVTIRAEELTGPSFDLYGHFNPSDSYSAVPVAAFADSKANSLVSLRSRMSSTHLLVGQYHNDYWIQAQNAGNNAFNSITLQPSGGFMGIGITAPQAKLHIGGSGSGFITEIRLTDKTAGLTNADWGILAQSGNQYKRFRIIDRNISNGAYADRISIDSNGYVRVGDASGFALSPLHVQTPTAVTADSSTLNITTFNPFQFVVDMKTTIGAGLTAVYTGGIGFAATQSMAGPCAGILYSGQASGGGIHIATSTTYANSLSVNAAVGLSVWNGKVGINNTLNPAVALDVNGEARSSTSTTSSSNAKTLTTKDYVDRVYGASTSKIRWVSFLATTGAIRSSSDANFSVGIAAGGVSQFTITHNAGVSNYGILVTGGRFSGVIQGDGLFGAYVVDNNTCIVEYRHATADSLVAMATADPITVMILVP